MTIKERLNRLSKAHPPAGLHPEPSCAASPERLLPGAERRNRAGLYWCNRVAFPLERPHGHFAPAELLQRDPAGLRYVAKDPALAAVDFDKLIFFDTETTGLSGGVGTLAFIIGVGFFSGGQFVVEQYFLRRFSEEPAMLAQFAALLRRGAAQRGALVSFNGKTYDQPLVQNRAVFHRQRDFPDSVSHIDLLHGARRLWKRQLPGCSLAALEKYLLGVRRSGDVPSTLIPALYFQYLRSFDPRPLLPVLHHNQADILSMVTLLNLMLQIFEGCDRPAGRSADPLAVGRILEEMREDAAARELYSGFLRGEPPDTDKRKALLRLARLHKANREYDRAVALWERALACRGFSPEPYEELAKACEHHLHDLSAARAYTRRALSAADAVAQLRPDSSCGRLKQQLQRRLQRIERKLQGAEKAG